METSVSEFRDVLVIREKYGPMIGGAVYYPTSEEWCVVFYDERYSVIESIIIRKGERPFGYYVTRDESGNEINRVRWTS